MRGGDLIRVDYDSTASRMTFFKEAEDMPAYAMVQMVDTSVAPTFSPLSTGAGVEGPRAINAKGSRR